jgi:hypothetical protein
MGVQAPEIGLAKFHQQSASSRVVPGILKIVRFADGIGVEVIGIFLHCSQSRIVHFLFSWPCMIYGIPSDGRTLAIAYRRLRNGFGSTISCLLGLVSETHEHAGVIKPCIQSRCECQQVNGWHHGSGESYSCPRQAETHGASSILRCPCAVFNPVLGMESLNYNYLSKYDVQ